MNSSFQERSPGQQRSLSQPVPLPSPTRSASPAAQTPVCGRDKREVRMVALPESVKSVMTPQVPSSQTSVGPEMDANPLCTVHAVMVRSGVS